MFVCCHFLSTEALVCPAVICHRQHVVGGGEQECAREEGGSYKINEGVVWETAVSTRGWNGWEEGEGRRTKINVVETKILENVKLLVA